MIDDVDDVLARVRQLPAYCPDCHYRTCSVWQDTCLDLRTLAGEVERLRRIVDAARGVDALYLTGDIDCSQRVDDALGWLHITLEDGHDDA